MTDMHETESFLRELAQGIDAVLNGNERPKKVGFVLLIAPFDIPEGARTNYISNSQRPDILVMLKEVVARFEGQAEITGHG